MREKIEQILNSVGIEGAEVFVPEHESQGHYSTNVAMRMAKELKKPPMELASEFIAKINNFNVHYFFEKIEVAPPGFINFWIAPLNIHFEFEKKYKDLKNFGHSKIGKGKKVIVEYSQPNIAKKMHVGHLRTTIIGDAIANMLDFLGYKVIRWNYLGDWGTQFGKLIAAYKLWGDKSKIEANPIEELQALYVKFHDEMKTNADLEKRGQEEFKKLETGDRESTKLWEWFKKESLKEFEKMYSVLGVKFDAYIGESFYEKDLKPLVERLLKNGVAKISEGAVVVPLEKYNLPPALIQKSDGASLYLTRDIANLEYRLKKYKPEKILYVVGNEQSLHFEQLFAIADILGLNKQTKLVHVKYGLVLGEEGKKLATREGRTILLEDVINKGIKLARNIVESKNQDLSVDEKDEVAKTVGIGAIKYNDLKENRMTDITFNWDKMLATSGESAPYLQYTYARLKSILRKKDEPQSSKFAFSGESDKLELQLIRKIFEFPDVVSRGAEDLGTSNLANYLYKLATLTSQFYEKTPILKEGKESRRAALLALVEAVSSVLKSGLGLLGIKTLEKI